MNNELDFKSLVKQDIINWLINYVEKPSAFYDYKMPPCPYAKQARLSNGLNFVVYNGGNLTKFLVDTLNNQIDQNLRTVIILPSYTRYYFHLRWIISHMNQKAIGSDLYIQYGTTNGTASRYPGLLKGQPYFIVTTNKLSEVLEGEKYLESTGLYYTKWDKSRYDRIVGRRRRAYEKYLRNNTKR